MARRLTLNYFFFYKEVIRKISIYHYNLFINIYYKGSSYYYIMKYAFFSVNKKVVAVTFKKQTAIFRSL